MSNALYLTWELAKVVKLGKVYDCNEIQSHQVEADTLIPLLVNHAIREDIKKYKFMLRTRVSSVSFFIFSSWENGKGT